MSELEQRYGTRRGPLTPVQRYVLIGVAIALAVLASYIVFRNSEPKIQGVVDTFTVTSATQVVVSFEVHKPATTVASCVVRARNAAGAEVGRAVVTVPAGSRVTRLAYTLATKDRAITGELQECGQADQ